MSSSPSAVRAEPFAFEQLDHTLLRDAPPRPDPDALVAAAQAEAEAIRAQAQADGVADARVAALAQARAELQPAGRALADALEAIGPLREEVARQAETRAVELALDLAERVVAGTLAVEPARIVDVVGAALRLVVACDRVTVLVHPDDVAAVRGAIDAGEGELATRRGLALHPDPEVPRGGALLRTSVGEVDARVATMLDRARELVEQGPSQ